MPCIQLLPRMLEAQWFKLRALGHPPTNFSPDFDTNARCVSHSGALSQDIEYCKGLKYEVWYLFGFFSKVQFRFGEPFQALFYPQLDASYV